MQVIEGWPQVKDLDVAAAKTNISENWEPSRKSRGQVKKRERTGLYLTHRVNRQYYYS